MKKILISFFAIISLISFVGCGNKKNNNSTKETKKEISNGRMYKIVNLKDSKINVFKGIIPSDWSTSIESDWNIVNSEFPGLENVYLSSPDRKATIKIISQQSYTENKKNSEGENKEDYTTYLHYMNASDYLDYYIKNNYSGAKLEKEMPADEQLNKQIKEYNDMIVSGQQEVAKQINAGGQMTISYNSYATSTSKKQYIQGTKYLELSTAVVASKSSLKSSYSELLNSDSIVWNIPYIIIYSAEDKETFDKYYDDYIFMIANSSFTIDYYALIEYVSSSIINAYTTVYEEKSKAGLKAINDFVDSNYSSYSSKATGEKIMEMWNNIIKDADSYKLEDGTILKTSNSNEVVAQKDNKIYIGDRTEIPEKFKIIAKYIKI